MMRYLIAIVAIAALFTSAHSAEINIGLDRCVILNDSSDISAPSKIVLHFGLPDSLRGKEIVYAELDGWLSLHQSGADSLVELYFNPLLADWPDGAFNYHSIETVTDSLDAGTYTIRLGDSSAFSVDLTGYLMQLAQGERPNYGLIGTVDLLGDANLKLPEGLEEQLRDLLKIRVICK